MHDPLTVAWEVHRPWPQRTSGRWYWPSVITIWHHEPGGADAGTLCHHSGRWRWHVHHWRIRWDSLYALRRTLLTRCQWCGGRSRKDFRVNHGKGWHEEKSPWWKGESGLYHGDCISAERAWNTCTCPTPDLGSYPVAKDGARVPREYGDCATCGRWRAWQQLPRTSEWALAVREAVAMNARPAPGLLADLWGAP